MHACTASTSVAFIPLQLECVVTMLPHCILWFERTTTPCNTTSNKVMLLNNYAEDTVDAGDEMVSPCTHS